MFLLSIIILHISFINIVLEFQDYELSENFNDIALNIRVEDGHIKLFAANDKSQDIPEGMLAVLKFKILDVESDLQTLVSINNFQWHEGLVNSEAVTSTIAVVTSIKDTKLNTPKEFHLEQNFPNPFNPQTTIKIHVLKTSEISLVIYNIRGQEIYTLFNGTKSAGIHQFVWKGHNNQGIEMSTGTYIVQMKAGNTVLNKKIQLGR